MSSLREMVFYSISHGDLTPNANEETGADRIGALARSDPLGAALWRVTGSHDVQAFREAIKILSSRIPLEESVTKTRMCRRVIEEWLACVCDSCGGRKFVVSAEGVRSTCPSCKGTGHGRASDNDRIKALHLSFSEYSKLSALFEMAHAILSAADSRTGRQVAYQLERRKKPPKKQRDANKGRHGL